MRPSYTQTVAPTTLPVTLDEAKAQCRWDSNDENALIEGLIRAATEYVQHYQWSQLITATWRMKLDTFPCDNIELHPNPVQSVTSIAYTDTGHAAATLTVTTDYVVDTASKPARIVPAIGKSWPATDGSPGNVTITFNAGWGAIESVPSETKHAILLLVGHWFMNRESVGSVGNIIAHSTNSLLDLNSYRVFY